ncbi:hypothetical protein I4641_00980 [Waterburya agarophytonicola K14]|uniref:Uncharacterized protein n=1 Tax=Waterburya agarophytonicola KI4 TaxID=2874699 RepID=A0A964BNF2_9CYAN|nr:hypothetical protein [Waterburya agarophytonicola]MCC0175553.1 hypothetical protein [Waterburya agarophytonicola KI4]
MSNNYDNGLALFAGCDSLFQDLTAADESTIAGGRRGRGRGRSSNTSGRSSNTSGRTRTRTGR